MRDLGDIRVEIDQVDKEILNLFNKRMELACQVAEYKIATGKKVYDKEREDAKLEKLSSYVDDDFSEQAVKELYTQIMSISRKKQFAILQERGVSFDTGFTQVDKFDFSDAIVCFQGVQGAYSQLAMLAFFDDEMKDSFHVDLWRDAMEAISTGKADYAVLPIENSLAGSIEENFDLLSEYNVAIIGEQILKVDHALLGVKGATINDIKTVYSHPKAIAQCENYIRKYHIDWDVKNLRNTAMSAQKIQDDGDKTQTWGGSLYMIASNMSNTMKDTDLYGVTDANGDPIKGYGTTEAWDRGVRARKQFSQVFFGSTAKSVIKGAPKDVVPYVGDDRAIFYTLNQSLSIDNESSTASGLIYMKYNNLHADGSSGHDPGSRFVDTDYPMLRLAEAYLISAEADARQNGGSCTATGIDRIKALRKRANVTANNKYDSTSPDALTNVSLEDIFKEWSREFGYEGMRRMVLVRWNRFAGQSDYVWEWMGGTKDGTQFDQRFNIFPIPDSELNANPNIKPNYQ